MYGTYVPGTPACHRLLFIIILLLATIKLNNESAHSAILCPIMSSSWDHSRKSRRYRPRSTRRVPSHISLHDDTIDLSIDEWIPEDHDHDHDHDQQKHRPSNDDWAAPCPRVQIIPGHIRYPLDKPWMCPPEPQDAPPTPTEMIRIVVVGDIMAGKTTIVQSFVHRRQSQTKRSSSVVDYYKKDVTFWRDHSDEIGCARLQLWDVSGLYEPDLDLLLAKAHVVICVVSLEHGQSSLMKSIQLWNKRLEPATVRFLLHKADMLPAVGAADWIQLGSQIASLMKNDSDYYVTTCASNLDNTVHNAIMKEVRRIVSTRSIPAATIVQTKITTSTLMEAKAVPMYSLYNS